MARFNPNTNVMNKTTNLAGGEAFVVTPEIELVSLLLTSFVQDQYYRSANDTIARLLAVMAKCKPEFVAKAAIYARTTFGMRSISHVVAAELAQYAGKEPWAKSFYEKIVHRPDDMLEIMAYYLTNKSKKLPNAMKKGFALAFDKFDAYSLAKYRGEGKAVKMVDVVNLVHPKPIEKNADALAKLMKGELKSFDTWEKNLSEAGQIAENEEEKAELKAEVWRKLIQEKKIGYFALLRNLRNIIEQAPEMIDEATELLVSERLIKKSLVLPFRFTTAFEEIEKITPPKMGLMDKVIHTLNGKGGNPVQKTMEALATATEISLQNVPKFEGETLVVLDVSGSMAGKPAKIGALFAAVLVKANKCDFMQFDGTAWYKNVNTLDSAISIAKSMTFNGGSTDFKAIFRTANRKYDRIIILSDMQAWVGYQNPKVAFDAYCARTGATPFIYSFDLQGYGTLQFPENKVFAIAGFSEKIFSVMQLLESDKDALVNEIQKVVV